LDVLYELKELKKFSAVFFSSFFGHQNPGSFIPFGSDPDSLEILVLDSMNLDPQLCRFLNKQYGILGQCFGSGSAWVFIDLDLQIEIRIGNANPDPGARKLIKINKKT